MSSLSPDEQLQALRAADGNPGLLALATIDLAYPDVAKAARMELRSALVACAVPHWFNPAMLREMLQVDQSTADRQWALLTKLNVVEPFAARGPDAANVHEASRKALRRHLHATDRVRLVTLSGRIVSHLDDADDVASRIERIYHLLLFDPDAAAYQLERATGGWLKDVDARKAEVIEHALDELLQEGFLTDRAELRARMTIAMRRAQRGTYAPLDHADDFVASARSFDGDPWLLADAYAFAALQSVLSFDWATASSFVLRAREIAEQAVIDDSDDPINRSELAGILTFASLAARRLDRIDEAIETSRQALELRYQLAADDPWHVGHRRELALQLSSAAELETEGGQIRKAYALYRRSIELLTELSAEQPDHRDIEFDLISTQLDVARFEANHGSVQVALDRYAEAAARLTELIESDPSQLTWRMTLGIARKALGELHVFAGDLDAARAAVEEALSIFEELHALESNSIYHGLLAPTYRTAGDIALARDEADAAALAFRRAEVLDDAGADD